MNDYCIVTKITCPQRVNSSYLIATEYSLQANLICIIWQPYCLLNSLLIM